LTPEAEVMVLGTALGLLLALICYLITNLSPGGMVTPGCLAVALFFQDASKVLLIVVVTVLVYAIVLGLRRLMILYGKRQFAAAVLLGAFLQISLFLFLLDSSPLRSTQETLGFIVPGLIAYQLIRQPVVPTLVTTGTVSVLTYTILVTGLLLQFIPVVQG
jgi:poly-gamma-glutamate biosynthesis protein PgsC/CapC